MFPKFRVAFEASLKTDPLDDSEALPDPMSMLEYLSAAAQSAKADEARAVALIDAGEKANEISDRYVLYTVVFATVLFLAAVAERFRWRDARFSVVAFGATLLAFGMWGLLQLPGA